MPLFEELVRRTLAARGRAEVAQKDPRRVRTLAQLLREANAGKTLLVHCAWCGRLQVGKEWLELAADGEGSPEIASSLIRKSSHGICPDCFARVTADAEAERSASTTDDRRGGRHPSSNIRLHRQ
jgi:hypothetical protein